MPSFPAEVALAALAAPAAYLVAALVSRDADGAPPRGALLATRIASLLALAVMVGTGITLVIGGSMTGVVFESGPIGFGARVDALSVIIATLVAFVGAIVIQFSRRYLDGDARQGSFLRYLSLTLSSVMFLALSGHLAQLFVAWVATSMSLHQLLVFYRERPRARIAAKKKWVFARLGDVALLTGLVLLYQTYGTGDIAGIAAAASQAGETATGTGAAVAIAIAALLKSAQFPFHVWLPDLMETPTPVSALLHAGVINAGGFLVIRFADAMVAGPSALLLLAVVGGFTAVFGASVALTQTSIKVSLAYSTVAQMGLMLFECGIGAFSVAALHLVAHSLYKAHAFLNAGGVVARPTPLRAHESGSAPLAAGALALLAMGVGLAAATLGQAPLLGALSGEETVLLSLAAVFVLGIVPLVGYGARSGGVMSALPRTLLAAALTAACFLVSENAFAWLLVNTVPAVPDLTLGTRVALSVSLVAFAALAVFQLASHRLGATKLGRAAYLHLRNGLYVNTAVERVLRQA